MKIEFSILGKKIKNYLVNASQDKDLLQSGVYRLVFRGGDNFYVGSTTESFKGRYKRHLKDLIIGKHYNSILQSAYYKYGDPLLEILEVCSKEDCISREQYYLDTLQPTYNICKIAGNTLGVKPSEKNLEKRSVKVDAFDLNGKFVGTYKSIAEACRQLGADSSNVTKSIRGFGNHSNNFQFRKHGLFTEIEPYVNSLADRTLAYTAEGNFIKEFPSKLAAAKELNVPVDKIVRNVQGKYSGTYNYVFRNYSPNYPLQIPKYLRAHKKQKSVRIIDFYTKEVFEYDSFNKVPKEICFKNSLTKGLKDFKGEDFIIKNRYIIQTKSCKNNEFTSNI